MATIKELREQAQELGISYAGLNKAELEEAIAGAQAPAEKAPADEVTATVEIDPAPIEPEELERPDEAASGVQLGPDELELAVQTPPKAVMVRNAGEAPLIVGAYWLAPGVVRRETWPNVERADEANPGRLQWRPLEGGDWREV
jgi:hypothetical protein